MPLRELCSFPAMRRLLRLPDAEALPEAGGWHAVVLSALEESAQLTVSEDRLLVRRVAPLPSEEEYDAAREFVDRQTSLVELRWAPPRHRQRR